MLERTNYLHWILVELSRESPQVLSVVILAVNRTCVVLGRIASVVVVVVANVICVVCVVVAERSEDVAGVRLATRRRVSRIEDTGNEGEVDVEIGFRECLTEFGDSRVDFVRVCSPSSLHGVLSC